MLDDNFTKYPSSSKILCALLVVQEIQAGPHRVSLLVHADPT